MRMIVAGCALALLSGCATVKVEAPPEPIEINVNVKIEHEIRVRVEKDLEETIANDTEIF